MTSMDTFLKRAATRLRDWAPCVLIVVPILLCVFYVYTFGVNVIWADQCDGMLPLFQKWYDGTLRFADFWAQHNEHRHVIPRLLMFALGLATKWNIWAELAVIQLIVLAMLGMMLAVFRRQCVSVRQLWLMLPLAFLATSLRQNENFLFGWQIVFILTAAAAMGTLFCLHLMNEPQWLKLKFTAATFAATVATYSAASGLLVWPAGVVPLLLLPHGRWKKLVLAGIWLTIGAAEWTAYFWDYARPAGYPQLGFSWQFFSGMVGGALFATDNPANVAGDVILVIAAISAVLAMKAGSRARYSFWLAMLAFGLLTQLAVTVARSGVGSEQARCSRYATFSLLVVIGAYAILSGLCVEKLSRLPTALWGGLVSLVVLGLILSAVDSRQAGIESMELKKYEAYVFCTLPSQPDEAIPMAPGLRAAEIRRGVEFLKEHRWNLFASDALALRYALPDPSLPTLPVAARVMLTKGEFDKESKTIVIAGWAVDEAANDLAGGVCLEVDGVPYLADYGLRRDDVVALLKNEGVAWSGFMREFSPRQLGAGRHLLTIKVLTKDRGAMYKPSEPLEFTISE